ncbi:2-oxoacid:acceptor oxidoreductase subunit alpha [Steroidobacter sp. S1-65]|uniref:2-oxoacid:acceptor oxidoreductase subunit alpha n=1 Tax=Steroidobacter gossypii TaxID=2805490 RepID=A0ABS1WTF4_9GAMM|nr:2-oxoacid:acceptor oxidoreductase subunit alpha [Steroidobacter gossypii]MBM0104255.1 2-oxoacid:acceptor oxidoreductase subunit alpha [Steroidobacter gossypii]
MQHAPASNSASTDTPDRLNDFVIKLANVNGTGSASANTLLMKSIFRMGIPVMGKNYFPSNIQGLPTWYEIRISRDGYVARSGRIDFMVAMNAETYAKDVREVSPGGYLLYDSTWPRPALLKRDDITIFGVPLARICNETFQGVRARILLKNIVYAGVLGALLDIELDVMRTLLGESYANKKSLLDSNLKALELGYNYAKERFACPLPLKVRRMDKTADHIMIDGNTAAALGCMYAGATVGAWYPITPSTSLMDAFKGFCQKWRIDPETGKRNYVIVQCEDELAAIGAVIGAAWNGARSFTPTSGPGISLMNEFIGLAYYAEVPAVIFDIQRVGPSTGMPTRTQQCDLMLAAYASHGDTRHVLLFPNSPEECFYMAAQSFDLAERLQTPVFVLSDLDIGMNDWMCPTLKWDDEYRPDRGKVLSAEQLEQIEKFYRYLDKDGDAIPYRTLPGTHPKGAYFTRGSGHTQYGGYTEDSTEYQIVLDRLKRKFETAKTLVPKAVIDSRGSTSLAIVSLGSCDGAVREALDLLRHRGVQIDYMRVRAFPFGQEVEDFLAAHSQIFIVEQNRDAQLRALLTLETAVEKSKLHSILHYSGLPISSTAIVAGVLASAPEQRLAVGV